MNTPIIRAPVSSGAIDFGPTIAVTQPTTADRRRRADVLGRWPSGRRARAISRCMVAIVAAVVLGGCASARRPVVWDASDVLADGAPTIRFDNQGQREVDVYLVGDRQEWRLGRVAAGATAKLDIPEAAIVESAGFVRLAVIAGGPPSARAGLDPRSRFSIAQPLAELPQQRFTYVERQLGAPQLLQMARR